MLKNLKIITLFFISFFIFYNNSNANELFNSSINFTISPIKYEIEASTWTTVTKTALLFNRTNKTITINTWKANFEAKNNSWEPIFIKKNSNEYSWQELADWIQVSTWSFDILPNTEKEITFDINIPADATPGWHYWALFFKNSNSWSWQITVNVDYWILLLITVDWEIEKEWNVKDTEIRSSWWYWWGNLKKDDCPLWDFSSSYYDKKCIDNIKDIIIGNEEKDDIIIDDKGNIIDDKGNIIVDNEGNIIDDSGNIIVDNEGNIIDDNGNIIVDNEGNIIDDSGNIIVDDKDNIVDDNGNIIVDNEGNVIDNNGNIIVDDKGNIVDDNGNIIVDSKGNIIDNNNLDNNIDDKINNDFSIIFSNEFENTWNTHIKPEWEITLFDEDWNQIKWIWEKSILNKDWAIIWKEIVDYLPINDVLWNVLPNTSRNFWIEWKWFPYKAYDDKWNLILKYWSPDEYYSNKNLNKINILYPWNRIIEEQSNKTITAITKIRYTDENWEEIELSSAKEFDINYMEKKIILNPMFFLLTLIVLIIIFFIFFIIWLIFKKKKKKCINCKRKIDKDVKICPYCWTYQDEKERKIEARKIEPVPIVIKTDDKPKETKKEKEYKNKIKIDKLKEEKIKMERLKEKLKIDKLKEKLEIEKLKIEKLKEEKEKIGIKKLKEKKPKTKKEKETKKKASKWKKK